MNDEDDSHKPLIGVYETRAIRVFVLHVMYLYELEVYMGEHFCKSLHANVNNRQELCASQRGREKERKTK